MHAHQARPTDQLLLRHHTENEVHHNSSKQRDSQDGRPEPVVNPTLTSFPNALGPPMECDKGIYHGGHCDDCEEAGRDASDTVSEVEQSHCQSAEDDSEVEPGEEGSLVGEENLGLYAGRKRNAFACVLGG